MARRNKPINLPAPYLRRIWLEPARVTDPKAYPFCLPFLAKGFDLSFDRAVTIVVGENGVGKSTLLEGIAALAGYDQAGGARDTCRSIIPTRSMFQAPTFRMRCGQAGCPKSPRVGSSARRVFSRSRYLDSVGSVGADFLSHWHGEGFLRFFEERCQRQGIYMFDEPESVLSPNRRRISETAAANG